MDQSSIEQQHASNLETVVDDIQVKDLFFDAPVHLLSEEEHGQIAANLAVAPKTVHALLEATVQVNKALADLRRQAVFHTDWSVDGSMLARDDMRHHAAVALQTAQTLSGLVRRINREVNGDLSVIDPG